MQMLSYVPRQFVGRLEPDTSVISAEVLHLTSEPLPGGDSTLRTDGDDGDG